MTWGAVVSPLTSILKIIASVLGRKSPSPSKRLEAHLIMRGIVAELPDYLPFHISDEQGNRHKGVYVIGMVLWNKGTEAITHTDFLPKSPLQIKLGNEAKLVGVRVISVEDDTLCETRSIGTNKLAVDFDCLNPGEYLLVSLFVTGNAHADIQVTGRIIGQSGPIDHTAAEVRASLGERLTAFLLLLLLINALPGFLIGGGVILQRYGWRTLIFHSESLPSYLATPFFLGATIVVMYIFSRLMYWNERRNYPEGYPLRADLEPPLLENVKGMIKTVFQAKKQRLSVSIFEWGKPVLMPAKRVPRHTIDDWIK